jgi:hypothetical protein
VVWLNSKTGVFLFFGQRYYANTLLGAFVCRAEAIQERLRGKGSIPHGFVP